LYVIVWRDAPLLIRWRDALSGSSSGGRHGNALGFRSLRVQNPGALSSLRGTPWKISLRDLLGVTISVFVITSAPYLLFEGIYIFLV